MIALIASVAVFALGAGLWLHFLAAEHIRDELSSLDGDGAEDDSSSSAS